MATHEEPPSEIAPLLLGLTEGDEYLLRFDDDNSMIGGILEDTRGSTGEYFDRSGRYRIHFEAAGVEFDLTMQYHEDTDGTPRAESLDLRLIEGSDWSIPITSDIDRLSKTSR